MSGGPLTDSRLGAVEACLNDGRLEEAQQKLVALGGESDLGPGVSYLTTKLLFLRGRLDPDSVRGRLEEVIAECPDFPEAETLLRITNPPPREPTPPPSIPPFEPSDLGALEPPRSEVPTEPAPPPGEDSLAPALVIPGRTLTPGRPPLWPELELELGTAGPGRALLGLEKLAAAHLDQLLIREVPAARRVALESMNFLTTAPISHQFAPFDLSLKSLTRLDAFLSLFGVAGADTMPTALSILVACYAGECVRTTRGGTWRGRVTEPEHLFVEYGDESYAPLAHAEEALRGGSSLRASAGPPLHPAAEPPDPCSQRGVDPPTPWDPAPWPELPLMSELGRGLPASAIGAWASRVLQTPLDRTPRSVDAIHRYLGLVRPEVEGPSGKTERRAALLAGAYLGELVCLHRAGRWNETDAAPEGPLHYEVLLPDGSGVYPVLLCHHEVAGFSRHDFRHAVHMLLGR
jgi:hypothetical protein